MTSFFCSFFLLLLGGFLSCFNVFLVCMDTNKVLMWRTDIGPHDGGSRMLMAFMVLIGSNHKVGSNMQRAIMAATLEK